MTSTGRTTMTNIPSDQAFYIEEKDERTDNADAMEDSLSTDTDSSGYQERAVRAIKNHSTTAFGPPIFSQAAASATMDLRCELPDAPTTSSFSTTNTDASDYQEQALAAIAADAETTPRAEQKPRFDPSSSSSPGADPSPRETHYLSTRDAYDRWATVYDTDGNVLQAIDDLELTTMLPSLLSLATTSPSQTTPLAILDIGCGTGRNTYKLLTQNHSPSSRPLHVTGVDFSSAMLATAESKLRPLVCPPNTLTLLQRDPFSSTPSSLPAIGPAHALLSTLVLENVPLKSFFRALAAMLFPGGVALVTNMHEDMGKQSQAGFVAPDGSKVRGVSWAHSLTETLEVARQEGFEVVDVRERAVEEGMVGREVGARGRKWVGVKIWFGICLRRIG